ncbi:PAS domain S-box protein [Microcoleus sp. FACHB-1515]|uniref:PAS domain S-box protein n=1 Tax=Cyanophyceae TaxID=3028117 RepID=UPI0016858C56|nr:PAS domain S-box protein [Microcoleus sp. FACHB-1515]MBD2091080.1 PAS domain S-box protein [Microcoleus sp. FACHB-1515]
MAVPKTAMVMQRADGSIEACNASAETILGWTLKQMQGWSSIDFSTQAIHPNGAPFPGETHPAMETLRTGLPCQNVMMGLYRPDGGLVWLLIDSQPLFQRTARTRPDAVIVTFADVTQQIQANAAQLVTMQGNQPMLESLRQNQQFTDHLINTIPGVLHLIDVMTGQTLYVSEQARNLLGYAPEQVMEPGFMARVMHPDDRARLPQHFDRLQAAPDNLLVSIEYRMRHANGEWRWFSSQDRVFTRTPDGKVQQVLGISQDISDRKQSEFDLQRSEITAQQQLAELEFIYATAPIGLCFLDTNFRFVRINDHLAEINGLPAAEHIGRTIREIIPEMADQLEPLYRQVLETGKPILNLEVSGTNRAQPGVLRDWLVSYYPMQQGDRAIGINVMVQEITDRRRNQEALRQREQRLSIATSAAGLGIFDWDMVNDIVVWENQRMYEIFGQPPDDLAPSKAEFFSRIIHPDDRATFEQDIAAGLQSGTGFHTVYRICRPDGEWRWIEANGQFTLAPDQTPVRMLGVVRDITHRKQAEIALQESERRFRVLADSAPTLIWVNNTGGGCEYVNRQYLEFFDKTLAEVQGFGWTLNLHPDDEEAYVSAYLAALRDRLPFQAQTRVKRADGQYRWIESYALPRFDESGEFLGYSGISFDISDRKQIEIALHQSNAILNTINESTTTLIYVKDCDGRMLLANSAAIAAIGKPEADVIGKTALEFCQPREAAEQIMANDRLIIDSGETLQFEEILEMSDRRTVYLSVKSPYRDEQGNVIGLIGISTDISDRKQAEADLRNSEARYRILAEAIPQFVFVTTPDGQNEYVNQQFCRYTGLDQEQLLGSGWLAIVHPDDLETAYKRWFTAVQTGSFYEVEYRFRSAEGQYRWFLGQGIPLKDDQGCVVKWFGTCTDIHEQKQIEVERSRLLAQEQAAREQAETANRIKDEFLAILSHELRTPLNPILGWSKLLQTRSFAPDKRNAALATIERNAQLQVQLIDDLLDVSRIIRGKLTLNLDSVSLTEVIQSALETVRLAAEAKAIAIDTDFDPQVGTVLGDAGRLQQIVWNLLSNAIKFTPNGGRVQVQLEVVAIEKSDSAHAAPTARLTISDTGKGISPNFLPYIFEAFRQQDGSTTRKFGGLGLGLAIVRQLVELHGGTITAESAGEGQGATFTVELPLMPIAQPIVPLLENAIADLQGIRVLAVDDELDSLEILTVLLEQEGAIVTAVDSTAQAIEALQHDRFDLLVSDIGMPEADGYVLIAQVRALQSEAAKIPAIALTAYASEGDQQQMLAAGYQRHLAKPIDPDLLTGAIAQLVG